MAQVGQGSFSASVNAHGRLRGSLPRATVGFLKELICDRGTVVDILGGTGVLCGALWRAGCKVLVFEPDPANLAQLRRALPKMPAAQALPWFLPLPSGCADAVVMADLNGDLGLERILEEALRVSAPEGMFICIRRESHVGFDPPGDGWPGDGWHEDGGQRSAELRLAERRAFKGEVGELDVVVSVWN